MKLKKILGVFIIATIIVAAAVIFYLSRPTATEENFKNEISAIIPSGGVVSDTRYLSGNCLDVCSNYLATIIFPRVESFEFGNLYDAYISRLNNAGYKISLNPDKDTATSIKESFLTPDAFNYLSIVASNDRGYQVNIDLENEYSTYTGRMNNDGEQVPRYLDRAKLSITATSRQ